MIGNGGRERAGDHNPPSTVYKYYAYAANYASDHVSAFAINAATGALSTVAGSPFATDSPAAIAIIRKAQQGG
ncbi:MAG: hypothetical protein ABFD52_00765 [Acidobacteriota bacterium]